MPLTLAGATLLGAGISSAAGFISNLLNKNVADENLEYYRQANEQNIAFQKQENDITRMREDNAYSRAAIDLENAGLSKTLAAGNPASAQSLSAPTVSAPNNQMKYESTLAKMNLAQMFEKMVLDRQSFEIQKDKNDAEIEYIKSQTAAQNLTNSTYMEQFANSQQYTLTQIEKMKVDLAYQSVFTEIVSKENEYKAQQLQLSVDQAVEELVNTKLKGKELEEAILNKVKEREKMDSELAYLAEQLVKLTVDRDALAWDLNYAIHYNLPVGQQASGLAGSMINASRSLYGQLENWANNTFNFHPDLGVESVVWTNPFTGRKKVAPMMSKGTGGGHAL